MQEYKGFTLAGPERTLDGQFLVPVMDENGAVIAEGTGETLEDATEDAKAKIDAIDF
jgi:predicted RNase H-like HicB family nuclease